MSVEYKVTVLKYGGRFTMLKVKTRKDANQIKDELLESPCHSGKSIIIEKTVTTLVSSTPFTGADLTY